eukprot:TRINITY_DN3071_c0_g1_i3.p1 TRINITY_DN3071_c0_g1~~TRINITY_DN3071_c0_g1_i3.p1  ORF type:complete len:185 (+),score=37.14 TRINITY_DN3071_c0_g1_i3:176-730(+)
MCIRDRYQRRVHGMNELVNQRLNESDCKINGWVLEGFPKTEVQMTMLKGRKEDPSLVVVLQIDDDIVQERHEYKKIDPITGVVYNLKVDILDNEEILARLVNRDCDTHEVVKKRLKCWKEFLPKLEEAYIERRLSLNADKSIEALFDSISEAIENPINQRSNICLLYTSPSPRDLSTSRMPSSA